MMTDPPTNPLGGKTLIVDANDGDSYPRPSAALLDAGEHDQVVVRPGIYEDKVFIDDIFYFGGFYFFSCLYKCG